MAATGIIAPNIKWYVFTECGTPAVGGTFATFNTVTGVPMVTYSDPGLTMPNAPVIGIGSDGAVMADLYWKVGEDEPLYKIVERDRSGKIIKTFYNYPIVGGGTGGDVTVVSNATNFAENEQYAFWPCGTTFTNDELPIGSTQTATAWYYTRSNQTANITISQFLFPAGDESYPFTPKAAYRYQVTSAGADSLADHTQRYQDVQTFQNEEITRGVWAQTNNAGTTSQLSLVYRQYFGIGGSPTIETVVGTFVVNDAPAFYPFTFVVNPISGNTIGSGSYIEIGYRFLPEQIQDILLTDEQLQLGTGTGLIFPYVTEDFQYVKILPETLAGHCPNTGTDIIGTGTISTPAATDMNLTQYLHESFFESPSANLLIGWNFFTNPNQYGLVTGGANGQFIADQTILQSDGNGRVSKVSQIGGPLSLQVVSSGFKFGILQIIETLNSTMIKDQIVSMAALIRSSAATTCKMALIGWNGTPNMQARQSVQAWNAVGVDPTLNAGWNYIQVSDYLAIDSASSYNLMENIAASSAYSSYGVFIWDDSADLAVGQIINFYKVSLVEGINATDAENLDIETVLSQCRRYYVYSSYPLSTLISGNESPSVTPQQAFLRFGFTANESIYPSSTGVIANYLSTQYTNFMLPEFMYKIPTVSIFNPASGAASSAHWYIDYTGTINQGSFEVIAEAVNPYYTHFELLNQQGFLGNSNGALSDLKINAASSLHFNYIADANIGV